MDITRRNALKIIGATPVAAGIGLTDQSAEAQAHQHPTTAKPAAAGRKGAYKPKFFTAHEWATVALLSNIVIPKDERSGSATDAGVPEFMDFMMTDQPGRQTALRGGLAWLDRECVTRFDKAFVDCAAADRTKVLDDIAWPRQAPPGLSHGVAFFNSFRDLTASGFWTTKMGMQDLQYMGNVFVPEWKGCPDEVLNKLGIKS